MKIFRRKFSFYFFIILTIVGAWYFLRPYTFTKPPLPNTETLSRAEHVKIYRDGWGIAHIHGATDADAAFGLAFAHSEDDWQNIYEGLVASKGKLSLIKPSLSSFKSDYLVQFLDVKRRTEEQYPKLSIRTQEIFEAYAQGIQYFAFKNPDKIKRYVHITAKDIAARYIFILAYMTNITHELTKIKNQNFGSLDFTIGNLPPVEALGSNAHAIAAFRTNDQTTRININPHQPWEGPLSWYEAHLSSDEGWNMYGATFAGSPFLFVGHNEDLAWTHTVNAPDLVDSFQLVSNQENKELYQLDSKWESLEKQHKKISVDLGLFDFDFRIAFYKSYFGPTLKSNNEFYSLRYAGQDKALLAAEQWYEMSKAKDFESWQTAMHKQAIPLFNTVYADHKNIFYVYNGLLPKRQRDLNWTKPVIANKRILAWNNYLSYEELPQVLNPATGFIQSCNSSPFQTTNDPDANPRQSQYDESLGIETVMTNRAIRSLEIAKETKTFNQKSLLKLKWDRQYSSQSSMYKDFIQPILIYEPQNAFEKKGLELLRAWDGKTHEASTAASIAILSWLKIYDPIGLRYKQISVEEAFKESVAFLQTHYQSIEVPLAKVQKLYIDEHVFGLGGGPDVMNAVTGTIKDNQLVGWIGDSFIQVVEFGENGVQSFSIQPYGNSRNPESAHFRDQTPLYLNQTLKQNHFYLADVKTNSVRRYTPSGGYFEESIKSPTAEIKPDTKETVEF